MIGGTLVASRDTNNHSYLKKKMERLGFTNVHTTNADKDGLTFMIQETKPDALLMCARFYQCSTPYMIGQLHRKFPKLYLSVMSIGEYPADLAMYFIINGAKAYISSFDGVKQFCDGMKAIMHRRKFIPLSVQKRIDIRKEYPAPARKLTKILTEVLRCICNGFSNEDIADNLAISYRTVETHRKELYRTLNARTPFDLFITAIELGIVTIEELVFRHRNLVCTPLPEQKRRKKHDDKDEKRELSSEYC